jgi:hypothetical protein
MLDDEGEIIRKALSKAVSHIPDSKEAVLFTKTCSLRISFAKKWRMVLFTLNA